MSDYLTQTIAKLDDQIHTLSAHRDFLDEQIETLRERWATLSLLRRGLEKGEGMLADQFLKQLTDMGTNTDFDAYIHYASVIQIATPDAIDSKTQIYRFTDGSVIACNEHGETAFATLDGCIKHLSQR